MLDERLATSKWRSKSDPQGHARSVVVGRRDATHKSLKIYENSRVVEIGEYLEDFEEPGFETLLCL